jgi:pimeloyl-ACP methyl ester carboxylesterase
MKLKTALLTLCLALPALAGPCLAQREEERVTLNTEDGWNLNARYLKAPAGAQTLVLIHAQKCDLTEWEPLFRQFKRYGFGYLALDLRGHGNSFVMPDGSTTTWKAFSVDGQDNEYNKMLRDVEAAITYLSTNSVTGAQTVLVGDMLGANLAIKAAAIHPEISMVVAVSPLLNVNAVLSVNPLRAYGDRPILLVAGADRARQYAEFQILNRTAQIACGRRNVTVLIEPSGLGPGLLNKYNIRRVLDWIRNPRLPPLVELSTATVSGLTPPATDQAVTPETEQAPMPDYSQD